MVDFYERLYLKKREPSARILLLEVLIFPGVVTMAPGQEWRSAQPDRKLLYTKDTDKIAKS